MKISRLPCMACAYVLALSTTMSDAALIGRLETAPGSGAYQAYYDDLLDITWIADTTTRSIDTWDNQIAWAAGLTVNGITGWRLPSLDVNGDGSVVTCFDSTIARTICADNEFEHLNNYGAGTVFGDGISFENPGPFTIASLYPGASYYWTDTEIDPDVAWVYDISGMYSGPSAGVKALPAFAWAVHDGDVAAVPIPATAWLFVSGLLGLIGIARTGVRSELFLILARTGI